MVDKDDFINGSVQYQKSLIRYEQYRTRAMINSWFASIGVYFYSEEFKAAATTTVMKVVAEVAKTQKGE